MLELFYKYCQTHGVSGIQCFERAWMYLYSSEPDVTEDYCQYMLKSVLPEYVEDYLLEAGVGC